MKKLILVLALIFNLPAFASDNSLEGFNCFSPIGMTSFFLDIFKDPCEDKLSSTEVSTSGINKDYCKCLNQKTTGMLKVIRENFKENSAETQSQTEKATKAKKDKLDHLYRFINYEVGFQEQKFGLVDKDQQIGCTPKKMAETVTTSLCTSTSCQADTEKTDHSRKKKLESMDTLMGARTIGQKVGLMKEFLRNVPSETPGGEKGYERYKVIAADNSLTIDEKLYQMNLASEEINAQHNFGRKKNDQEKIVASPYDFVFKDGFEEADKKALAAFEADHKKSVKHACVTYEDFKVIDSVPTSDMMDTWKTTPDSKIAESFLAGNLKSENGPVLNFLHRNPVIAKNIVSDSQRKELAKVLKEFAQQNSGVSGPNLIRNYSAFMKTKIKDLNKKNEMGSLLQCDLLAQNYAAASDKNMSVANQKAKDKVGLDSLMNNVHICEVMKDNFKSKEVADRPSLAEVVNASALFAVFHKEGNGSIFSPETDVGYNRFLKANCDGYAEIENADKCSVFRSKEGCDERGMVTDSGKQRRSMEKFYKKNPLLGALVEAAQGSTEKLSSKYLANKTDEKRQNTKAISFYEANVKPFLSDRNIYSTEDVMAPSSNKSSAGYHIAHAVENAQGAYSASQTPSEVANYSSHTSPETVAAVAADASSGAAASSVNPGHFVPPYMSTNNTTPEAHDYSPGKINTFEQAAAAVDNIERVPKAQRQEVLSKAKEVIEDLEDDRSEAIEDYKKKIADLEHKNEEKAAVADNTRVASKAAVNSAPVIPSAVNRGPASVSAGFSAPVSSGSAMARLSAGDNKSKAAASYDRALIQANEAQASSTPSLVVESSSQFDFVASPVTTNNLVVGTSLEPSQKLFAEISSDAEAMKSYLAQNLKEIPEGKVISIKCKGDGCQPQASELLFMISKAPNNKFSIRSVKVGTEVVRQMRYKDLKQATKKI